MPAKRDKQPPAATAPTTPTKARPAASTKPKAAGGRPPAYDWSAIRRRYIRGNDSVTLESLSHETGAPKLGTLKNRAAAEDWADLRKEFRDNSLTKHLDGPDRDLKMEIRADHLKFARALRGIVVRGMAHIDPKTLGDAGVYRLGKLATDIERKAVGMDEVKVRFGRLKNPEDLDDLTEAELWRLAGMLPPDEEDDDDDF